MTENNADVTAPAGSWTHSVESGWNFVSTDTSMKFLYEGTPSTYVETVVPVTESSSTIATVAAKVSDNT